MAKKRQGPKLVASKQISEIRYICSIFTKANGEPLIQQHLRVVMNMLGKNGKPCRSRAKIYQALYSLGYVRIKSLT